MEAYIWLTLFFLYSSPMLRVFGHFSLRSEWQLVKVDYKPLFSQRCNKDDYQTWHLHNQVFPMSTAGMRGAPFPILCCQIGTYFFFSVEHIASIKSQF